MSDTAKILAQGNDHLLIERTTNGQTNIGLCQRLKEGQSVPEDTEVLLLSKQDKNPKIFNVEVIHTGPARVSNSRYRANYDTIFGSTKAEKELLN